MVGDSNGLDTDAQLDTEELCITASASNLWTQYTCVCSSTSTYTSTYTCTYTYTYTYTYTCTYTYTSSASLCVPHCWQGLLDNIHVRMLLHS